MITLRGVYKDNQVTITDEMPLIESKTFDVLITFLDDGHDFVVLPASEYHRLVTSLTIRELEILNLVYQGKTNREIGEILEIGEGTTRNYLSSAYSKLKAENRVDAIRKARELGLID